MPKIYYPYYGARISHYVYHPALHGASYSEGQFERAAKEFHAILNDFVGVAELYVEQQSLSEAVGGQAWKRDVLKMFSAVEKDGKNVYVLEALAEAIFDRDNKSEQRILPYHEELKKRATVLLAEDYNMSLGAAIDPLAIMKRSWGS